MPELPLQCRATVFLCLPAVVLLSAGFSASGQDEATKRGRWSLTQTSPGNADRADSQKAVGRDDQKESADPALWLSLARHQIEQGTDRANSAAAWAIVAVASQQLGVRQSYRQSMGKAVSQMKAQSVLNPANGVNTMLG